MKYLLIALFSLSTLACDLFIGLDNEDRVRLYMQGAECANKHINQKAFIQKQCMNYFSYDYKSEESKKIKNSCLKWFEENNVGTKVIKRQESEIKKPS